MNKAEVSNSSTKRFEFQRSMLEKGFEQVQKQIIHLDEILFKIKASAITLWVALMGWSFTSNNEQIVPLGAVVIIGFWFLEAQYKGVQLSYIEASEKLVAFVNDYERLNDQFSKSEFETGMIYPLAIERTEKERLLLLLRGLISPTVATVYLFIAFTNMIIWLIVN